MHLHTPSEYCTARRHPGRDDSALLQPASISSRVRRHAFTASLALAALVSPASATAATLYGQIDDRQVNGNGTLEDVTLMYAGRIGGSYSASPVFVFKLPTLPVGQKFDTMSFTSYLSSKWGTPVCNLDLYGLGVDSAPGVIAADYFAGSLDSANTLLADNYVTSSTANNSFVTASGAGMADYLNACYSYGDFAGEYVFLRLSPDNTSGYSTLAYLMASRDYQAPSTYYSPRLVYTTTAIGTPGWSQVPIGGGGYVTGLVSDASGSDIYCRTDVGGAFRWDAANGRWISLSDTLVSANTDYAATHMPVSSLAVDPNDANKIYMAVGYFTGGASGTPLPDIPFNSIYASSNKGSTWTAINTTLSIRGNEGKSNGERLVVDPNNSNILWFGSRIEGLQKGVKSGSTWTWTQVPSTSVPFGQVAAGGTPLGISFVACDKNGSSTIVYAGVYDTVGTTGGVYQSTDGGATWSKVSGAAVSAPWQGRLSADGTLYVTAGTAGVFRMPRGGSLAAITTLPASYSYRSVAVAPGDPAGNILFVSEAASNLQYNRIWRSADGGATWSMQHQNLNNLVLSPRTEPDGTPSVGGYWFGNTSALLVNPVDSNELWASDFFGVARTQNAQNLGTTNGCQWYMLQKGQEETVVTVLKNAPTGARLIAGVGDIGGYRYRDTYERPVGNTGGSLTTPGSGNTYGLDFCESNPDVWARAWSQSNTETSAGSGGVSTDGGLTWLPFGCIARKTITNSATAGTETFDVGVFLANQKAIGNNTVTFVLHTSASSTTILPFESKESATASLRPKLVIDGVTDIPVLADSYVEGANTTTNFGNADTLRLSGGFSDSQSRWVYLKFDLSSVSSVTTATLQLNRKSATTATPFPVSLYACANTTWVEGNGGTDNVPANEIRWANKPATLASSGDPFKAPNYGGLNLRAGRVAVSATDPNNMVWLPAVSGAAARYSKDRGVTWTASTGGPGSQMDGLYNPSAGIHQLASDRVSGDFYLASFGGSNNTGLHKIYKSTNGGVSWTQQVSTLSSWGKLCQLVAAPGTAGDLWLADESKGLWHSTDGGTSWTQVGLYHILSARGISFGMPLAGSGQNYSVYLNAVYDNYTTVVRGIYRSDDGGSNWTNLGMPTIQHSDSIAGDRQVYGRVFIGTQGRGIFQYQ